MGSFQFQQSLDFAKPVSVAACFLANASSVKFVGAQAI